MKDLTWLGDSRSNVAQLGRTHASATVRKDWKDAEKKGLDQEPSSGNVFADLGLPDAGEHLTKAGLVVKIARIIRQRRVTRVAAAEFMGIDQPKVSAMLAGHFAATRSSDSCASWSHWGTTSRSW